MVRQRADPPLLSAGAGAYGGSQLGAVVRYALSPESTHRPATYLRVATAMRSGRDRQAALGLSARPLPRLPVALLTELRVQQGEGRAQLRPAVALVGGMTQRLPMNLEADGYGQAGWVGGTFATAFFDGQATVDRRIAPVDGGTTFRNGQLRLGGAVWSGGQRGATRLDVGPRLTLRGQLGETNARLALDWRFRVAGRAEPGSGPVLTLAAGF